MANPRHTLALKHLADWTVVNRNPHREQWREVDSVSRSAGWRIGVWILVFLLFGGILTGGIWWFKVATSDIKGAGDQTRIVNDAQNRIQAQEWFHEQYQLIRSTDGKLDGLKADLTANLGKADESWYRSNLTSTVNRCKDMVGRYNAETKKVTKAKWLDPQLPFEIDPNDTTTDCEPTK